ncbi:tryptophan 2,3-dioxygenase (plasmid) [Caballeronia sp. S22]
MNEAKGCPFGHGAPAQEKGWHDAKLDFSDSMSYGDYLGLDSILNAQHPLSPDHNEMLFIVQHQTSELWMKLALYELRAALAAVHRDELPPAFKMLARVSRIFEQLVQAWNVLATMTPSEYTAMRPYLGQSSGFQSHQYRQIEFMLGNKNTQMLKPHEHRPEIFAQVRETLEAPSFYDEVIRLLARRGFEIDPARLNRDWTQPTTHDPSVEAAWLAVYRDPSHHWELYEMGGGTRRSRRRVPAMALPACDDGRAHHRLQGRHGRDGGRVLSAQDARCRAVSRTLARADHALTDFV